jgi:hypothetical protein
MWQQVRQPVLAQWGELDRDSVPVDSSRIIHSALDRGGNPRHITRIVPDVNHNLHVTANDGFDRLPRLMAGYGDYEAAWIVDPPHTMPGTTVPPSPNPQPSARILTPPAWYHETWLQLAMMLMPLVAFASHPLATARRIRRRAGRCKPPPPARWLALLGASTIVGTHAYLLFLLVTAAKITGPVVLGRPILWLTLQLLAVATLTATAAVALCWRRHHRDIGPADRIRFTLLTIGGILFVPWAISWGLLGP